MGPVQKTKERERERENLGTGELLHDFVALVGIRDGHVFFVAERLFGLLLGNGLRDVRHHSGGIQRRIDQRVDQGRSTQRTM